MRRDVPYRWLGDGLWATHCPDHEPPPSAGLVRPMFEMVHALEAAAPYRCRPTDLDDPEVTVR